MELLDVIIERVKPMINFIIPAFLLIINPENNQPNPYDRSSFDEAVYRVLKEEGGLANDKNDRGGITNYGISINYLRNVVKENPSLINEFDLDRSRTINDFDIKNMSKDEAIYIYKTLWWDKYNYGKIGYQPLANKIFELSVNIGPLNAGAILVKACSAVKQKYFKTTAHLDENITSYINSLSEEDKKRIVNKIKLFSLQYYMGIVKRNPSQRRFIKGWTRRVES